MQAPISSKLRKDVKKLMQIRLSEMAKLMKEFYNKKAQEGTPLDLKALQKDPHALLEFQRYSNEVMTSKRYELLIPKDIKFERVDANGVPCDWITCPNCEENKVLFWLFGGGYVMGDLETRKIFPFIIGREAKIRSLLVGYRIAPEHPFPAALDDAVTAYRWLISTGISPNNIIIGGASAGGGLAVALLLKLRELDLFLPAGAVLLSPWTDLACTGESWDINAEYEAGMPKEALVWMANVYSKDENPKNPLVSPLYGNLEGLPPMLIHAGNCERLRDDSVILAERATSVGVNVELKVWDDMLHVFQQFYDFLPESNQSIEEIGEFIHKILN